MEKIIPTLDEFFTQNSPAIIKNMSTQEVLLCLDPQYKELANGILLQFESLNERGGNSVTIVQLHEKIDDTLYFESDIENMFQLRALNLYLYKTEIQPSYFDAPDFDDETEMRKYVLLQLTK